MLHVTHSPEWTGSSSLWSLCPGQRSETQLPCGTWVVRLSPCVPQYGSCQKIGQKDGSRDRERDRERWAQQAAQTSPTDKGQTILRNWPCVSTGKSMWNHFMLFLMTEIKRHDGFSLGEALQQRTPWVTMKRCRYYFTLSLTWSFSKLTLFKLIVISLHLISLIAELLKTNSPLRPS